MSNPTLQSASSLLEILEFTFKNASDSAASSLPMSGIIEIISQVRSIIESNMEPSLLRPSPSLSSLSSTSNITADTSKPVMVKPALTLEEDSPGFDNYRSGSDRLDFSSSLSNDLVFDEQRSYASLHDERSNSSYRPRVKTVPPEVRGRIRELVGIESEESI